MRVSELWRFTEKSGKTIFRSKFLDWVERSAQIPGIPAREISPEVSFPSSFSFIDNPDESLGSLWRFVQTARYGFRELSVDQGRCESIDLCAASVLNVLAMEARLRLKCTFGGRFPADREAKEIVIATGLPHVLGIPGPPLPHIKTFDLRKGGTERTSLLMTTQKERVADDLTDYVASIFARKGFVLTLEGKKHIGRLVGEVLGNAEDHAPGHDWWACAYLREPSERNYGDCHLTLFNFGPSLAETMAGIDAPEETAVIEELIMRHVGSEPRLTRENVLSMLALQDGMTRHAGQKKHQRRGFGTADMIEAFQLLGRSHDPSAYPSMCLISGNTYVSFDPRYPLKRMNAETGTGHRIIAFNAENNLDLPPDPSVVRPLLHRFPGTLLSMRFFVDGKYLESMEAPTWNR
jgi:hypothetical protein